MRMECMVLLGIVVVILFTHHTKRRQQGPILVDGRRHKLTLVGFPKGSGSETSLFEHFLAIKAQLGHETKIIVKGCW